MGGHRDIPAGMRSKAGVNQVTAADVYWCAMPGDQVGIRPLARAHHKAAAALFAATYPDRADEPAGWGAPCGPTGPRRYVAVAGAAGRIVGYGGGVGGPAGGVASG